MHLGATGRSSRQEEEEERGIVCVYRNIIVLVIYCKIAFETFII